MQRAHDQPVAHSTLEVNMVNRRSPELQKFIDTLAAGFFGQAMTGDPAVSMVKRIMNVLDSPNPQTPVVATRQPVNALLGGVVNALVTTPKPTGEQVGVRPEVAAHARAILALSDQLAWWRRPDANQVGEPFTSGHANAIVIGQGGLEERSDVTIGISLVAPYIDYPEHHHSPEEVYFVLTPGQWQQNGGRWCEPGPGSLVHNPPNILHAMRSGASPLLATWCLWTN